MLILAICCENQQDKGIDYTSAPNPEDVTESIKSIGGVTDPARPYESTIDEKIIRTAYSSIQVSRVDEAYDKALNLVKKYDAIILNSSISRRADTDEAHITIKILPVHFMTVLDELNTIGRIESKTITEEDVTEEYYDIKARLGNARKVQERLFGILKKANKVADILKVEKEIERIGENIEVLEGKLRYLDSKVDYSRISMTIYSKKVRIIDFSGIGKGFKHAIQYSIQFFFIIIWFIIIILPVIILVFVLKPVVAFAIRKFRRQKTKK
jgi:hypothetical protein